MTEQTGVTDRCQLLIDGGRVLDPESGRDAVGWLAVTDGVITGVGAAEDAKPAADQMIDASGLVVAPGFIDLHSHAQTINGARLQALDGVTTALELEAGAVPLTEHYDYAAEHGRVINYGYSAGWAVARMMVLDGAPVAGPDQDARCRTPLSTFEVHQGGENWRGPASAGDERRIVEVVRTQIEAGGIGIGVLQGYVPDSRPDELALLARLAAEVDQPLFVHARSITPRGPHSALDAVVELVEASERYGASIHLCHLNSTSLAMAHPIADALAAARQRGVRITTEGYPYPAGSTVIGAAFLDPDELVRNDWQPGSITYLPLRERIADADRLRELRELDPGGLCIITNYDLDDPEQRGRLLRCLTFPDAAVASDAMPLTWVGGPDAEADRDRAVRAMTEDVWPLPPGLLSHPRSAGCFAMALSWLSRELGALSLPEVVRRATLVPATVLGSTVPAMARKGRLQVGMDADVTVFDPAEVAPGGDFSTLAPSRGFRHVLVGGVAVVSDGELDPTAAPGRGLRGSAAG